MGSSTTSRSGPRVIQFGPMAPTREDPTPAGTDSLKRSPPRSTPAAAARAWSSGARPAPPSRRAASAARTTGRSRSPASATRRRGWRSSAWRRPPTAPTAPAGCSPATAPATGSTRPCTAPATPTSPSRATATTGCGCATPTSPPSSAARRRPTGRRPAERDNCLPYLERELRAARALPDDRRPRRLRLGRGAAGAARARRRGAAAASPASATAPRRELGALDAARLLPPEPAEHLHRPPDRADDRRRLRPRARAGRLARSGCGLAARLDVAPAAVSKPSIATVDRDPRLARSSRSARRTLPESRGPARASRPASFVSSSQPLLVDDHRGPAQVAVGARVEGAGSQRLRSASLKIDCEAAGADAGLEPRPAARAHSLVVEEERGRRPGRSARSRRAAGSRVDELDALAAPSAP